MSAERSEFQVLIDRARQGSPEAAEEIVQMFGEHVLRVVRHHLDRRVRPLYDSTDISQEVWGDFFSKALPDHKFADSIEVRAYLGKMGELKAAGAGRAHLQTQKGDVRRENELSATPCLVERLVDPTPGPAEIAADHDEWEQLLRKQPKFFRQVLELLRQGNTAPAIAAELEVSVSTVRRAIR